MEALVATSPNLAIWSELNPALVARDTDLKELAKSNAPLEAACKSLPTFVILLPETECTVDGDCSPSGEITVTN